MMKKLKILNSERAKSVVANEMQNSDVAHCSGRSAPSEPVRSSLFFFADVFGVPIVDQIDHECQSLH